MAQKEEPLYDFPEPTQKSERKFWGIQRGRASLRSISVLDRLLLTVPVWLQLSINSATALHIMQREPPGAFLVRKSRTSQRNVLCVRLADDSVPSFVQQFGIREENSSKTLSLESSAISFPDLPRLISFYCVSRDVLPFPLELPEAIAKAASHKELESISHMGIEFWSSQLNVRGPRELPKPQNDKEKNPDTVTPALPTAAPQTSSAAQPDSAPQPNSDNPLKTTTESDAATTHSGPNPTLFHEFCPITTRSPGQLDCGSGQGALCFINPLFLQSQNASSRRCMFKHSLKVRLSMEHSTNLSPPLAPPPPPPLMPKTRGKCKGQKRGQGSERPGLLQGENQSQVTRIDPDVQDARAQMEPGQSKAGVMEEKAATQLPTVMELLPDDSDYMRPGPVINTSLSPSLSPYLSPSLSPKAPPLFPKVSPSRSPHDSPCASPSLSPYQSPSLSPRAPAVSPKVSLSRSPHDSPCASPSLSPYQSPSLSPRAPAISPKVSPSRSPHDSPCASPSLLPHHSPSLSPKVLFSLSPHDSPGASPPLSPHQSPPPSPELPFTLSPFASPSFAQLVERAHQTPIAPSRPDQRRSEREAEEEGAGADESKDGDDEELRKKREGEVLKMNDASLSDTDRCSLEGAAETPTHSPYTQDTGTSL